MIQNIRYCNGYDEALLDVLNWFESCYQEPNKQMRQVIVCLRRIWAERNQFIQLKSDFEITFTDEDLKYIREISNTGKTSST